MGSSSSEIPTKCRAAVCRNQGPNYYLELVEDFPVPVPKAGDLLLRLNCTGLCLTDVHFMEGDWGDTMTCSCPGHEGAGVVVALASEVNSDEWKVGDRVGHKPITQTCKKCDNCRSGWEQYCEKQISAGLSCEGSYAQYVAIPAEYATRIPDGLKDELAGPMMCSGSTMYAALLRSEARIGQWVAIPGGGGGVGSIGLQLGKAMGLRMIAIDTGDEKKQLCLNNGAEAFIDFRTTKDVVEEVNAITNGGAHAVIVTGSTAAAYTQATYLLRQNGVQVCVSLPPKGTAYAGADPFLIVHKNLTVRGSMVTNLRETSEALDIAARGLVSPVITVFPFHDWLKALDLLKSQQVAGRIVIDFNQ